MTKKKVSASFAITPKLHDEVKVHCETLGVSVSEFICDLVTTAIRPPAAGPPPAAGDVIPVAPGLRHEADIYCRTTGRSVSDLVAVLLAKAITLPIGDHPMVLSRPPDDMIPILLKMPRDLRGDRPGIEHWMGVQSQGIVRRLAPA